MKNLIDFALKEKYYNVKKLRSRLEDMKSIIDWNSFLKLLPDNESGRGRHEYDKILMIKIMFLQGCYSIKATRKLNSKFMTD